MIKKRAKKGGVNVADVMEYGLCQATNWAIKSLASDK